jgi:hypothetical protein
MTGALQGVCASDKDEMSTINEKESRSFFIDMNFRNRIIN